MLNPNSASTAGGIRVGEVCCFFFDCSIPHKSLTTNTSPSPQRVVLAKDAHRKPDGSLLPGEIGIVRSCDEWCERPYLVEGPRGDTHWYTSAEIAVTQGALYTKPASVSSPVSEGGSPYVSFAGDILLNEMM